MHVMQRTHTNEKKTLILERVEVYSNLHTRFCKHDIRMRRSEMQFSLPETKPKIKQLSSGIYSSFLFLWNMTFAGTYNSQSQQWSGDRLQWQFGSDTRRSCTQHFSVLRFSRLVDADLAAITSLGCEIHLETPASPAVYRVTRPKSAEKQRIQATHPHHAALLSSDWFAQQASREKWFAIVALVRWLL
jgi:hypothetical protein